jgi:hypothetical protein
MISEYTTEPQARQNERLGQTMAGVIDAQHHNTGSGVQRYPIVVQTPQIVTHTNCTCSTSDITCSSNRRSAMLLRG